VSRRINRRYDPSDFRVCYLMSNEYSVKEISAIIYIDEIRKVIFVPR